MGFATSKIKIKKNIIGFVNNITGYIMTIGVAKNMRRKGIGCMILEKICEILKKGIFLF